MAAVQGGSGSTDSGFLSPRGRLVADERTNTLMISDIPKKIVQMKELIRVIDRPVDQVLIEARVVIATETFARELGAKFGISGASGKPGDRSSLGFGGNVDSVLGQCRDRAQRGRRNGNPRGLAYASPAGLMTQSAGVLTNPAGSVALSILNAGYLLDVELSAMHGRPRRSDLQPAHRHQQPARGGDQPGPGSRLRDHPAGSAGGVADPERRSSRTCCWRCA